MINYSKEVEEAEQKFKDLFGEKELEKAKAEYFSHGIKMPYSMYLEHEIERNNLDYVVDAVRLFEQQTSQAIEQLNTLIKECSVIIEESQQIAILKQRKKHCRNFLERKQIERELNKLKFKQGKRRK